MNSEVFIIGAGPAGLSTAIFLAQKNISSIVYEKSAFPRDKICGDCLGGYALSVLKKMGIHTLQNFEATNKKTVGNGVHFFGPDHQKISIEATNFVSKNLKEVALIKRIDFDNFLYREANQYKEIKFIHEEITNVKNHNDSIELINSKGYSVARTKRLVVASGSNQQLIRKLINRNIPKNQMAAGIRAYFENVKLPDNDTYIELHFLKTLAPGYLWIFPLPNNQVNVGIGIRSDVVSRKKVNLTKELYQIIEGNTYLRDRFKEAVLIDKPKGYPLFLGGKKREISGNNFLLTGDAANLIEPLFGEGIGHAMYSGYFAAEHIKNSLARNDFGAKFNGDYDRLVYDKLNPTLKFSAMMQKLAFYPAIMSFLFNRLNKNSDLSKLMFGMINGHVPKTRANGLKFLIKLFSPI